ncbi:MAG: hypothetical protein K6G07_03080 [Lachnospiraceae bacterium]|nr:hypothetical protein [Lachnospiraceae bacterium]
MKVIKTILIEIVILVIVLAAGFGLDYLLFFSGTPDPNATGHPMPVFTMMLPIGALFVMAIVDVILIIVGLVKLVSKKS